MSTQPGKPVGRRRVSLVFVLLLALVPLSYILSTRILQTDHVGDTNPSSSSSSSSASGSGSGSGSGSASAFSEDGARPNATARMPASTPAACDRLLADRLPFDSGCNRTNPSSLLCDTGAATFLGQSGQDHYVYTRHFKHLRRAGVYVDVAANDATHLSNTAVFDRCLGWGGVCVEPNPEYHETLRSIRTCALHAGCVATRDGETVDFVFNGGFSGVRDRMKFPPRRRKGGVLSGGARLTCQRLASVLRRVGVAHVDYLSLDVEGSEIQVLGGIDWEAVRVDVVTVEVSKGSVMKISQLLERHGLVRHLPDREADPKRTGLLGEDAVFVHREVEFGSPR